MLIDLSRAGSIALLLVYGGVFFFFVYRFVRFRKPPSLTIAFVSTGWVVLACLRLGLIAGANLGLLCWIGVAFGAALLTLVIRADQVDQREPPG